MPPIRLSEYQQIIILNAAKPSPASFVNPSISALRRRWPAVLRLGPCGAHLQRAEGAFRPARRQRPRRGLEQVPLSRMARLGGRGSSARLPRDRRASPELAHPVAKASQARRNSSRYYLQIRRLPVVRESGHTFAFGNKVYIIKLDFFQRPRVTNSVCVDPMAAPHSRPLGIPHPELPWIRPTRLPCSPLQTIL